MNVSQRGSYSEERYEKLEFQREIQNRFLNLKEEDAKRGFLWNEIDARKSPDEVQAQIHEAVQRIIDQEDKPAIRSLWKE